MAKINNLVSDAVMAWLDEYPEATNRQIAKEVGCTTGYVWAIRKKMAYVPPCPEDHTPNAETEEALQEVGRMARDLQVGGDHYKSKAVQPWDVYDTWPAQQRVGAYRANCVKYIMRMDDKDTPLLNAQKLAHYAQKLVEVLTDLE